jgi:hypothetical protein
VKRLAVTIAAIVLVAACSTAAASPTVRPTLHLASMPPPVPEGSAAPDQGSGAPDGSAAPDGSVGPVGSGGPDLSSGPPEAQETLPPKPSGRYPDSNERQLVGYLNAQLSATCKRAGPFYPGELASVICGDGIKFPFVYYTLFDSHDDMAAGYAGDIAASVQKPDANENCTSGKYEDQYTLRARVSGRVWCAVGNSGGSAYKIIEWTRDNLNMIGIINSYDLGWDELENFWRAEAQPDG